MKNDSWRDLAAAQAGLVARRQLNGLGIDRFTVRNQVAAERWVDLTPTVVSTTTGPLSREQLMWLGVLHAGPESLVGGLTAAEVHGLRNWGRDDVTVLVPEDLKLDPLAGIDYVRTRRDLPFLRSTRGELPVAKIEPAILLFGAYQRSRRTAQGVVAAAVQQRLTTCGDLGFWVDAMRPLRWAGLFGRALLEIGGGAHSLAEIDVRRLCRDHGLMSPTRQTPRRDSSGRVRWTDCEWHLPDGHVVVLEVDGGFHMEVEHWEDDLARQRGLSRPDRTIVRCSAREVREESWQVARDLRALGVPGRVPQRALRRTLKDTTR
jgi:hypothetical protein